MEFNFGPAPLEIKKFPGWVEEIQCQDDILHVKCSSNWGTLVIGSDDRVYVSVSDQGFLGGNNAIYRYDPATDKMEKVFDWIEEFGFPKEANCAGHGKNHCRMIESSDHRIYFATSLPDSTPPGITWEGGHVLRYDILTERTEDVGVPVPGASIHAMWLDEPRQKIWGIVITGERKPPRRFFGWDMIEKRLEVLLPVQSAEDCLMDTRGMVYTQRRPGYILRYNPDENEYRELRSIPLPNDPPADEDPDGPPFPGKIACPSAHIMKDGRIIDAVEGGEVFIFDPSDGEEGSIKVIGPTFATGRYDQHQTNLALSPDEKTLYYSIHRAYLYHPDINKGQAHPEIGHTQNIAKMDVATGEVTHLGYVDTDPPMIFGTFAVGVAKDGTVYYGLHRPVRLGILRP